MIATPARVHERAAYVRIPRALRHRHGRHAAPPSSPQHSAGARDRWSGLIPPACVLAAFALVRLGAALLGWSL